MADNQILMHQMTVKGKRLASGLERFVTAIDGNENIRGYAYHYALGCLGGEYITKRLMKTRWLPEVVNDLVSQKLMKEDRGEKLKKEWESKYVDVPEEVKENEVSDEAKVETEDVQDGAGEYKVVKMPAPVEVVAGELVVCDSDDTKTGSKDEETAKGEGQSEENTEEAIRSFAFKYDAATKKVCSDLVPKGVLAVYYDILDQMKVLNSLPKTIMSNGVMWEEASITPERAGSKIYRVVYRVVDEADLIV